MPRIARAILGYLPAARRARLASFLDARGETIDQGLALYFPAPSSFTGEHVLELQGHGGRLVMDLLLQRALELGCRMARPGEFSERAFLNGKIDVAQAEAVADLIDAGTAAAAQSGGALHAGRILRAHRSSCSRSSRSCAPTSRRPSIFRTRRSIFCPLPSLSSSWRGSSEGFDAIMAAAAQGALLREGLTVVIAGKPNAGKSSLLNRLAGDEVAIVTAGPGNDPRRAAPASAPRRLAAESQSTPRACATRRMRPKRRASAAPEARCARADRILYVLDASRVDAGSRRTGSGSSMSCRRTCR